MKEQDVQGTLQFLNETTAGAIGFRGLWHRFEPFTAVGKDLKTSARPFMPGQEPAFEAEMAVVESALNAWSRQPKTFQRMCGFLAQVKDLRGSIAKSVHGGLLDTVELYEIKRLCLTVAELRRTLRESGWPHPDDVMPPALDDLQAILDPRGRGDSGFYIDESFSRKLGQVRSEKRQKEKAYREKARALREAVAAAIGVSPNFRGEVPVSMADEAIVEKAAGHPNLAHARDSAGYSYYRVREDSEARALLDDLDTLKRQEYREEERVRQKLSREIGIRGSWLSAAMERTGRLDFILAKVRLAQEFGCVRPQIADDELALEEGRHPLIEEALKKRGQQLVPVSISLLHGATVITGPNMGGKTVTLKTLGLVVAMAQYGLLVPAKSFRFSLRRFIYFSAMEDSQTVGLSNFGMEVSNLKPALKRRNERGLILLDELSRGTNPAEGFALSAAVLRYLRDTNSITVFATHYDGLASVEGVAHWQVRGLAGASLSGVTSILSSPDAGLEWLFKNMDYRLQRAGKEAETPKDALVVARLLGLDDELLKLAEGFLNSRKRVLEVMDSDGRCSKGA
ncbi:MAG: hypothetical protein HPY55_03840 [Firmicutes bacterium]|nr:hypothetical protein [Bacillota bacterium]